MGLQHPIRAILGLYIARQVPRDLRDLMDEKDVGGQIQKKDWSYQAVTSKVPDLFKEGLLRFYSSFELELKVYSILTLTCYLVDLLANLVFLIF